MQSTRSASMIFFRISPSPEVFEDIEPLARTKPAIPIGERWWMSCWTQAKFALPLGGTPDPAGVFSKEFTFPVGIVEGWV